MAGFEVVKVYFVLLGHSLNGGCIFSDQQDVNMFIVSLFNLFDFSHKQNDFIYLFLSSCGGLTTTLGRQGSVREFSTSFVHLFAISKFEATNIAKPHTKVRIEQGKVDFLLKGEDVREMRRGEKRTRWVYVGRCTARTRMQKKKMEVINMLVPN